MKTLPLTAKPRLWLWFVWLVAFYGTWTALVVAGDHGSDVASHWPIALSMALGSYVAGSTPMGGGTVGFPILVLFFHGPAAVGRDFSFAIQAIGMTSASIFILTRRQPLVWSMLRGSLLGSLVGTPVGIIWLAPWVPELWIKLAFAVVWAGFGVLHLYRTGEISRLHGTGEADPAWNFRVGLLIGLVAGASVAAITGVGIDMVLYAALVLLCRADLKVAIPTSVLIMAFTSIVGVVTKSLTTGFQPGAFENWLAAAPVVALGAPLGAYVVDLIGRRPTLLFVAALCVAQFVWMCVAERSTLGTWGIVGACLAVGLLVLTFEELRSWGIARQSRGPQA